LSDVLASNDDLLAGQEREDTTSSTAERHFHPAVRPRLDRSSDVPLYFQLAAALKAMLEVEAWEPGARFATEREIEEEFNVSRAVIRPALDLLVDDGAIIRVRGSGAFVAPSRSEV
jgi:GntR family transcriptional regulator